MRTRYTFLIGVTILRLSAFNEAGGTKRAPDSGSGSDKNTEQGQQMKKILIAAAAVAMPLGMLVTTAGIASAHGGQKVDVSQDSISCTLGAAQAQLAPKVTTAPVAKVNSVIAVSLTGCTVTGPDAAAFAGVTVTGAGTGVLHANSSAVTGLPATVTTVGKITVMWNTGTVHLKGPNSKLTVGSVTVADAGDGHASVAIGNTSIRGDFGGTDGGATSSLTAETTQTLADLGASVAGTGLHVVNLAGSISLG